MSRQRALTRMLVNRYYKLGTVDVGDWGELDEIQKRERNSGSKNIPTRGDQHFRVG